MVISVEFHGFPRESECQSTLLGLADSIFCCVGYRGDAFVDSRGHLDEDKNEYDNAPLMDICATQDGLKNYTNVVDVLLQTVTEPNSDQEDLFVDATGQEDDALYPACRHDGSGGHNMQRKHSSDLQLPFFLAL